jgi:hypothetical protein
MEMSLQAYDFKENKNSQMSYIRVLVLRTTSAIMVLTESLSNLVFSSGDRHGNS